MGSIGYYFDTDYTEWIKLGSILMNNEKYVSLLTPKLSMFFYDFFGGILS